ncbi:zinc-binding dehydrogenase, partial [Streptomyces sp. SBT349]|uniref:zinc-binding dehydrogenase n=1 Tax=Streptomyces sp. SBT349 TaxID=1580539 RepID=UPI00066C5E37
AADGGRVSHHGSPSGGFAVPDPGDAARRGITPRGIQDLQLPPEERVARLAEALDAAAVGAVGPLIGQTYPLTAAAEAHTAIETRRTTGKTLLLP